MRVREFVCMRVCEFVCLCVCVCMRLCEYVCACMCACVSLCACMCVSMWVSACPCVCVCMRVRAFVCMRVCACVCLCVCGCSSICVSGRSSRALLNTGPWQQQSAELAHGAVPGCRRAALPPSSSLLPFRSLVVRSLFQPSGVRLQTPDDVG